jgi:hypothetical protein
MTDFRLLNGKPRATLVQRFDGSALLLGPKGEKIEFDFGTALQQVQAKAGEFGWEIAVEHLHLLVSPNRNLTNPDCSQSSESPCH